MNLKAEMIELERQINALDVELDSLESEPLIELCFELGFFPWDNLKFCRFLVDFVESFLDYHPEWGRSQVRAGMYGRVAIALLQDQPEYDWVLQRLRRSLAKSREQGRWPTVAEQVAQSQFMADSLWFAALSARRRQLNAG